MTDQVPPPDPTAAAMRLRASDADRERVADVLREAYVEGRLSALEHEERIAGVYAATTYADLVPLLADLPVPHGTIAVPGVAPVVAITGPRDAVPASVPVLVDPSQVDRAQGPAVAFFGGVERQGRWVVPPSLTVVAVMGGVELDFTEAVLTSQETVVTAVAFMGGIDIRVPDGVHVRMDAFGFMGGTSGPAGDPPPGAPVIRITGLAVMGGIDVTRPERPPHGGPQIGPGPQPEGHGPQGQLPPGYPR